MKVEKAKVRDYFLRTYNTTEKLFSLLKNDEAFYQQPEPLRHPLIFYYGHVAVFYINKLRLAKLIDFRLNETFESIFAVGVDEMSWDDLNEEHYDWPSVEEVRRYRKRVKEVVLDVIEKLPQEVLTWESPWWVIYMGIEHENIHIETSSVLFRQLHIDYLKESAPWPICQEWSQAWPKNELVAIEGQRVGLGRSKEVIDAYGWDNEFGKEIIDVAPFMISKYLVTNGEFMEFVEAGGYEKKEFWSEEGWAWREYKGAKHPTFWLKEDDKWHYRAINKILPMPCDWPVDVNYHEAKAFCNYLSQKLGKKVRLPSEAEWHAAYRQSEMPHNADANISLRHYFSACPVTKFAHGKFYDMIGNVWQWTETPIYPYEGFEVHPIYDDFSTPTFDNRHNIIKGGSFISIGNEVDIRSRYAFRRHFFQHAGFRYVISDYEPQKATNIYESDKSVSQYLEFHYGPRYFDVPNFPKKMVELAVCFTDKRGIALDIGCAVGRASFELAKYFDEVTGLDFSARFIKNAVALKEQGEVGYLLKVQGKLRQKRLINLQDFDFAPFAGRCSFWQADACNLKPLFSGYDLVLALNLLDRLYDPPKFLRDIKERLNPGGVLVIATPFSWSEEFTPKELWIGGKDGIRSEEALKDMMSDCELLYEGEQEFIIRETERKFQHTKSYVSVWKKV